MSTSTDGRQWPHPVSARELDCLVLRPDNTRGAYEEWRAVAVLNALGQHLGYGRLAQLTSQLEDLWRHPEKRRIRAREGGASGPLSSTR